MEVPSVFRLRILAIVLMALMIGVPVMAQAESEDMSSPADATVVDQSSDAAQPADEAPPADQDVAPAEPAAIPTPPIQPVPTPPLQQAQPTAVTTPGSQTVEVTLN